ncbi:uncharacterized protein BDR25DRAFT_208477 [Lindgomyces ingoldianus]|uniref:Uncharacterized protein n=1 Tax=Lindgomyces ingoldianus TaxID=673940 RepID=A0ACB6RCZ7_9PLEO|nr:uncharacterized protein BDR25DRAFT_208477 [Lindgomyces ingoldianus]KAF2477061.1 hypothetical protein BDR25DRAFT_208477 [Lindgomyces ingoldianus]
MASLSSFQNPAAYHLLSYGTLLSSTLFQSFIGGIIAFHILPRPQFSTLQKHTFPVYFILQSVCPVLMALTYPSGSVALLPNQHAQNTDDRLAFTLMTTILITGLANMLYVGPQTTRVMGLRKHQETKDRKRSVDKGPHSKEMQALNKRFGMLHGVSSLVNLVGFLGMCWYGVLLGDLGFGR